MVKRSVAALLAASVTVIGWSSLFADDSAVEDQIARGRYLVIIAGCNDCHTPGYAQLEGQVPESEWLTGDALGWKGPWGTTYASNLRLSLSRMTEDAWVSFARNLRARPPMPSVNLGQMTEDDLRAMYAFISGLRPLGEAAPAYLPPGQEPQPPYVLFPSPPPE